MNRGFSIGQQLSSHALGSHGSPVSAALDAIPAVSYWLALTRTHPEERSQLSQAFQMSSYQLGEEIPFNPEDLYWVCQGRVRILCGSDSEMPGRGRPVTALLLAPENTFGADTLSGESLPYTRTCFE
jgi:hypothetical protein